MQSEALTICFYLCFDD